MSVRELLSKIIAHMFNSKFCSQVRSHLRFEPSVIKSWGGRTSTLPIRWHHWQIALWDGWHQGAHGRETLPRRLPQGDQSLARREVGEQSGIPSGHKGISSGHQTIADIWREVCSGKTLSTQMITLAEHGLHKWWPMIIEQSGFHFNSECSTLAAHKKLCFDGWLLFINDQLQVAGGGGGVVDFGEVAAAGEQARKLQGGAHEILIRHLGK